MDAAVGLVRAYLQANGYFTIVEYPIVERLDDGGYRSVTDIDVMAVRLPGAGRIVPHESRSPAGEPTLFKPDPRLIDDANDDHIDLIIGEVKHGKAELNAGARRESTLVSAIRRFTFVTPERAELICRKLTKTGKVTLDEEKVRIRMFAFGGRYGGRTKRYQTVLHRHCIKYLVSLGREYEALTRSSPISDPTIDLLQVLGRSGFLMKADRVRD